VTKYIRNISLSLVFFALFQNCSQNKELKVYDSDGVLRYEWLFEKDTSTGKKLSYWVDGRIKEIHVFENGNLNGEYLGYYANGYVARKSHFYNNIARGPALKFSEKVEGLVVAETYYLDVKGKQYVYYLKEFDSAGKTINEDRTLFFKFNCDSKRKIARVEFVDDFPYDSVHVIVGKFTLDFSLDETAYLDTIRAARLPIELSLDSSHVSDNHSLRGKCIFFHGTSVGDSTRIDVKTRYFEELVTDKCQN
jgi:hypothetical protein